MTLLAVILYAISQFSVGPIAWWRCIFGFNTPISLDITRQDPIIIVITITILIILIVVWALQYDTNITLLMQCIYSEMWLHRWVLG